MGSNPSLSEAFLRLVSPTNTCYLTKREMDLWGGVRGIGAFMAPKYSFSYAESRPAHLRGLSFITIIAATKVAPTE
jgi:hypothetical protein